MDVINLPKSQKSVLLLIQLLYISSCSPTIIPNDNLIYGEADIELQYQIESSGKNLIYQAKALPEGLTINTESGVIAGSPKPSGAITSIVSVSNQFGSQEISLNFFIDEADRKVDFSKELVITDPRIVRLSKQSKSGSWNFKNVIKRLSGYKSEEKVNNFFEKWAKEWATTQSFNNDTAESRSGVEELLVDAWKNERIDLIAIVNRIDLTRFKKNQLDNEILELGEGRLIYEVVSSDNSITDFTIIMEYGLPSFSEGIDKSGDLQTWARKWHALGRKNMSLEERIIELEKITEEFSKKGNLRQVRTNELVADFAEQWEMREFTIQKGKLKLHPVAQTPRDDFRSENNNSNSLNDYLKTNSTKILEGTYKLSDTEEGKEIQGIKSQFMANKPRPWNIQNVDSRTAYIFSFNTCNGCHKINSELNTENQHIFRDKNGHRNDEAILSPFLTSNIIGTNTLPGCETTDSSISWCSINSWNEREMRMEVLKKFAHSNTQKDLHDQKPSIDSLIKILGSRAH